MTRSASTLPPLALARAVAAVLSAAVLSAAAAPGTAMAQATPSPAASPGATPAAPAHPLDPLTWQEHWTVLEVLRGTGHYEPGFTGVAQVTLREPPKALVWDWTPGAPFPRHALAVLLQADGTWEAVVDVAGRRLVSATHLPGSQAPWLQVEFDAMEADVKEHPDFVAAMARRGITDLAFVDCGGGPPGYFGPDDVGRRIALVTCHDPRQLRNTWTRSIEGVVVFYDMDAGEVIRVADDGVVPVPRTAAEYDVASLRPLEEPLPPVVITQPLGPGFRVDGHSVEWHRWSFHLRPDHRAGMIISTARFQDGERHRPVLYQGHLSEIFVPYMDPGTAWYTRNFLDLGEYSAGGLARTLEPGVDCPEQAAWFSHVVTTDGGRPRDVPRAVCLFERLTGDPSWTHAGEGRPERELVARMVALLGNYDYVVDWVFRQDGVIRVRVGATGIPATRITTQASAADGADPWGRFVDRNIVAVNHDHYFSFRLDVDVDGPVNRVHADRLEVQPLQDSPRPSVWVQRDQVLQREADGRLSMDMHRPSLWRVTSATERNANGYPTGYQLVPGHGMHTLLDPADQARRRAGFIDHQLWVTAHDPAERWAAGDYPALSAPGQGLPAWSAANRSIADADVVLWYTVGMHHVVRAEDWPVMPVSWHSFELRPFDFFSGNPALRLPLRP